MAPSLPPTNYSEEIIFTSKAAWEPTPSAHFNSTLLESIKELSSDVDRLKHEVHGQVSIDNRGCQESDDVSRWFKVNLNTHKFKPFKVESAGTAHRYEYHVHYECEYCRSRRIANYVNEEPWIREWVEQETLVDTLKGSTKTKLEKY